MHWSRASRVGIRRIYVPVFWTDYYLRHGRREPHAELQAFIDANIDPSKWYFTIVHNDDGILERLPPNVLVFGAGAGDVPIPMLKDRPRPVAGERDLLCSFMGSYVGPSDRFGVRSALVSALHGNPGFHVGHGSYNEFVEITSRSKFALCPRGYGPSSYRLYEAMALGAVPVYVWAEIEWLPWRDEIDWDDLSVRIHVSEVERIRDRLAALRNGDVDRMRQRAAELFEEYFTLRGTCRQILARVWREG